MALRRGARRAAEYGADVAERIDWLHEDLLTWKGPKPASYDLVSSQFTHLPRVPRDALFRRLAASVAPGGTLLIVAHHAPNPSAPGPPPPGLELFFTASEVAASLELGAWEIVADDAAERMTTEPQAHTVHTHDVVLRARRQPDPR